MNNETILETNIVKIRGKVFDLDERVDAKTACFILDCSYSFLTKETSKRHGRKLPFYKRGNSRTSRLEFVVRDLLTFKKNYTYYYGLRECNS